MTTPPTHVYSDTAGDDAEPAPLTASVSTSSINVELEKIDHYKNPSKLQSDLDAWGDECVRSPTLDEPDDFITDRPLGLLSNVKLQGTTAGTSWDVELESRRVKTIRPHDESALPPINTNSLNCRGALLAPSLCHPHVHIDKAFLIGHPRYAEHKIKKGDFDEAMEVTGKAKAGFTHDDLVERGERLIDESTAAGVTHMRAFVEVDIVVHNKCLEAGVQLKNEALRRRQCKIQICAYAQLPLFSTAQDDNDGKVIQQLMSEAAARDDVDAIGSTPYVEDRRDRTEKNIDYMIDLSIKHNKHLDFHLDYNLDPEQEATVWYVVRRLKEQRWAERTQHRTIMLGHCTRLALFDDQQWQQLAKEIEGLPISFVGLPTSDLYMMRTKGKTRGTLDVPKLIKDYHINACLGINNIGNAFTPQGSCDPLSLACNGVGIYQTGTEQDAELLYECVSTRARRAIGFEPNAREQLRAKSDVPANFLLFDTDVRHAWRTRWSIAETVYMYDGGYGRQTVLEGRLVS